MSACHGDEISFWGSVYSQLCFVLYTITIKLDVLFMTTLQTYAAALPLVFWLTVFKSRASCNLHEQDLFWRQSQNFNNLCLFYTRRPQGNYLFPFLWRSSIITTYVSNFNLQLYLHITSNKTYNLFRSKSNCCSGNLKVVIKWTSGWFDCKTAFVQQNRDYCWLEL